MKNPKMNKVIGSLLAFLLLICIVIPAEATVVDHNRPGSITVTLRDQTDSNPVVGAEIAIYKVADTKTEDNNLEFAFTDAFQNCGLSIEDYYTVDFPNEIASYIAESHIQGSVLITDSNGITGFTGLTHGIYVVVQTKEVPGFSTFTPFISVLPITADSQWVYDVAASPKVDIERYIDISVQKVWNDDNGAGTAKRPDSVTIQLLADDTVVDSVVLNDKNGWNHTWEDLEARDDYTVKEVTVPLGYQVTYQQNGFHFTVINTVHLVQTGQLNWPVPVLIIIGLVLIAFGYLLRSRGKQYE